MVWTHERIVAMVESNIGESLRLEYKASLFLDRSDEKKTKPSKAVAAMANAAGGDIIFGVAPVGRRHEVDEGVDATVYDAERLDNVLGSTIVPKVPNLVMHQVRRPDSSARVPYVLQVPRSHHAPHMARDHIYYRRRNVEVEPMEEHEARDLYYLVEGPLLRLRLEFELTSDMQPNLLTFEPRISNESLAAARDYISIMSRSRCLASSGSADPTAAGGTAQSRRFAIRTKTSVRCTGSRAPHVPTDQLRRGEPTSRPVARGL